MLKTKSWIIMITIILVVCCVLSCFLFFMKPNGHIANIYVDGKCVRSIDLDTITAQDKFVIKSEFGSNTILIEPGRICVSDADCPDKVCVSSGWLGSSSAPIVCLPHRLVIKLEGSAGNGLDAVTR